MAQKTALTVYAIPGQVTTFSPKTPHTIAVPSAERIYTVRVDRRILDVDGESRVYIVPEETRITEA